MNDDSSEAPSAVEPDGVPPSASTPPPRPGRLRRRTAAIATVGGLTAGGMLGGFVVSHAAGTSSATPSSSASSSTGSGGSTSPSDSTGAAATTTPTPSGSTPGSAGSNENATHEQGESAQREAAENSGQFHGGGGPGGPHGLSAEDQQLVAGAIGITTAQLTTELSGGKTIAQVAQAHGADVNQLISAWVASENKEIDDRVSSGQLSKAQGDQMKAGTQQRVTGEVSGSGH